MLAVHEDDSAVQKLQPTARFRLNHLSVVHAMGGGINILISWPTILLNWCIPKKPTITIMIMLLDSWSNAVCRAIIYGWMWLSALKPSSALRPGHPGLLLVVRYTLTCMWRCIEKRAAAVTVVIAENQQWRQHKIIITEFESSATDIYGW